VPAGFAQRGTVSWVRVRFIAGQEGRADLRGPGAEGEDRGQAAAVSDAAGRDHGDAHRVHQVRELLTGIKRYSELHRGLKHATHKMLTQ
jgi:hypothetical protein